MKKKKILFEIQILMSLTGLVGAQTVTGL